MNLSSAPKIRVVIAGGSGFLGIALAHELLERGNEVVILTRSPRDNSPGLRFVRWDGKTLGDWAREIDGADAVVNLAGKSVNCRHTPENRREINASRVDSVRAVARAILQAHQPPRVLVQATSAAIYGDAGERLCDESTPPGSGFPVETCLLWENAFNETPLPSTRRVALRIGFVLGRDGGALQVLATLARRFLGGTVGSGRQYISWAHLRDMNRIFLHAIDHEGSSGPYNACTPTPLPNRDFMRELRRAMHRPWSPPAPTWAVHIGSRLMGTEAELALTGRRCIPARLSAEGFTFEYPELRPALENLLGG